MMRRSSRTGLLMSMVCAVLVAWAIACYRPTEIRLEITTDHVCDADPRDGGAEGGKVLTAIKVGAVAASDDPVTELPQCTTRPNMTSEIGSLVIVPSGSRDARVNIQVLMTTNGAPTKECTAPVVPFHCIVARRSVSFIEHESLRIPVRLYEACRGVTCEGETTCGKTGTCESAVVNDEGCTGDATGCAKEKDEPPPADAGRDVVIDAPVDAPRIDATPVSTPCDGPLSDHVLRTVPRFSITPFGEPRPPPSLLASNSTHLFWTEPIAGSGTVVKRMAKSGVGGVSDVGMASDVTVKALAASDAYLWVATADTVSRIALGPSPVLEDKIGIAGGGGINAAAVSTVSPFQPFAVTGEAADPGAVHDLASNGTTALPLSVGGQFIAVGGLDVFTAAAGRVYRHPLPWKGNEDPTSFPTGPANGLAADGATVFVSELSGNAGVNGRVTRYTAGPQLPVPVAIGLVGTPGAIAVHGANVYVLDHGAAPTDAGQSDVAPCVRRGPVAGGQALLTAITPPFASVAGLAIDRGGSECVYFMAFDGTDNKLRVYAKSASFP